METEKLEKENKRLREILAEIHDTDAYEKAMERDYKFKLCVVSGFVGFVLGIGFSVFFGS